MHPFYPCGPPPGVQVCVITSSLEPNWSPHLCPFQSILTAAGLSFQKHSSPTSKPSMTSCQINPKGLLPTSYSIPFPTSPACILPAVVIKHYLWSRRQNSPSPTTWLLPTSPPTCPDYYPCFKSIVECYFLHKAILNPLAGRNLSPPNSGTTSSTTTWHVSSLGIHILTSLEVTS